MSANRAQLAIAAAILVVALAESFQVYPRLPDPMVSTFGADGAPVGWSAKRSFMILYALSTLLWLGLLLLAPFLASRSRESFTLEQRGFLRDTFGWFLIASLAFSAWVLHLVFEANLESGRLGVSFVWALVVYLAYVAWWTVRLVRRVRSYSG